MAAGGAESGPFSRTEAAKRILALGPGEAVHVWREGMAGWKPATEVSIIAQEMHLQRPAPPPAPSAPTRPAGAVRTPTPLAESKARAARPGAAAVSLFSSNPLPATASAQAAAASDAQVDFDEDAFTEVATSKKTYDVEPPFTEVSTKKEKKLRDLGVAPLPAPSVLHLEDPTTPIPLDKAAHAGHRMGEVVPLQPNLGAASMMPKPSARGVADLDADPLLEPDTQITNTAPAGDPSDDIADLLAPSPVAASSLHAVDAAAVAAAEDAASPRWRLAERLHGQAGLKYLVAAVVLVVLVILLVVVTLRADSTKRPQAKSEAVKPEPATAEEPSQAMPDPGEPKAATEEPKAAPSGEERPVARSSGRRGAVKTRSVGPVEKPSRAQAKPGARPEQARPNPFAENVKPVSQDQISAVVRNKNNQAALKSCYERALKMDNHLTSGRMDVTVSIAPSGVVQRVVVNAPASFFMVEPCIKIAVKRWVFPPNGEEYGTNFPLIMQGGM